MSAILAVFAILLVVVIAATVALPIWTFINAKNRGYDEDTAVLWAVLVLFSGPVGIIAYFILAEDQ